jgi:hypothetical protein
MKYNTIILTVFVFLLLPFFVPATLQAQGRPTADTTIIFTPSNPNLIRAQNFRPFLHAWGLDILTSNNGFGIGTFYRYELSDEFSFILDFAISDVKDETEFEQYDYYTGQNFIPGKKNRLLLLPLHGSVQYRLFKDDIVDNFRPFITAGFGPTMVYVAPYATYTTYSFGNDLNFTQPEKIDFFTSLKYGKMKYTVGGFVGAGVNFGMEKGTLTSLSVKYLLAPFPDGIEVMQGGYISNFGGFFISLAFGSMF